MRALRRRWRVLERLALLRAWLIEDPWLKVLAFALAAGAWWWVQGQETATEAVRISLEWTLDERVVAVDPLPSSATAIVQGPRGVIRRARADRPSIAIDLREERAGTHEVRLASYGIERMPSGLSVVAFTPESTSVRLDDRLTRKLPVNPVWVGTPANEHAVRGVSVEPDTVEISGPRTLVTGLRAVDTLGVDVSGWTEGRTVSIGLDLPPTVSGPQGWAGRVEVELASLMATQTIQGVPVFVWGRPNWVPEEGSETVTVTLKGPTEVLRNLRVDHVVARVELPGEPTQARYEARYQAAKAPRLEILVPRPDVIEVSNTPGPVEVVRR